MFKRSLMTVMNAVVISSLAVTAQAKKPETTREVRTPTMQLADGWNHWIYFPFLSQVAALPSEPANALSGADQQRCDDFYSEINEKRSMKIILGLGYYDDSEGQPFTMKYLDDVTGQEMTKDFGMNATIDIAYLRMYAKMFTRPCSGQLQLCEFKEVSPGVFKKMVKNPNGKKVEATIEMKNSSYTEETPLNVGRYVAEQAAKTEATTRWFFDSIPSADLVIYNGHSRKGGGPDFGPPKLFSNLHVNYAYYAAKTPGLNRLLEALSAPRKPKALMLMSCNSTFLFSKKVEALAPRTSFTGTDAIIPGDIPTKGAVAGIDSMLRFKCENGFNRALRTTPEISQHLTPLKFK